jgi:DNA replication and repair protein RecF
MLIRKIALSHFRNVGAASLALDGSRQFLVGPNGQGKTNLLEAAGLVTALRSFRTSDARNMIGHGQAEAAVALAIEREGSGNESVTLRIRGEGKGLWRNDKKVSRLADYLGLFPTVVLCSEDLQLLRGVPALRRRWLDLTLSATDPVYLSALQSYGTALAARNALLRRREPGLAGQITAFEQAMAPAGAKLVELRRLGLSQIAVEFGACYRALSAGEAATLKYEPATQVDSAEGLLSAFGAARPRDQAAGVTTVGPHRDDMGFEVKGVDARQFASEGQQRSTVLALRLAQARWFHARTQVNPVLLADDVLGELDPGRRERFWAAMEPGVQVIATGTTLPVDRGLWQVFTVAEGRFAAESGGMEAPA